MEALKQLFLKLKKKKEPKIINFQWQQFYS